MRGGHNINEEYQRIVDSYGEEEAQEVFGMIYAHYATMTYLDTGLYDVEGLVEHTRPIAEMCGLEQRVEPATLTYLERLLCGPWDEDLFVVAGPHETIPATPFMQPGSVLEGE